MGQTTGTAGQLGLRNILNFMRKIRQGLASAIKLSYPSFKNEGIQPAAQKKYKS